MMTLSTTGPGTPTASELQAQISELENHYAEIFLINDDRALLRNLHLRLETLKQELKQKVPPRR